MNKFRRRTIVLAIAPLIALVAGSRFALAKVTSGPVHFGYVDEITSVHELCGEADIDVSGGYGWGSSRSWVRPHYSDCVGSEYGESFPA